jgi:20S proteasome alpha/beta subunit
MTVIIGLLCEEGLVIACDSQVEFERGVAVKRLNANKIYSFEVGNGIFAIAGAGKVADIERAIAYINASFEEFFSERGKLTKEGISETLEQCILSLHGIYNIQKSRFLGFEVDQESAPTFNPLMLIGGVIKSEKNEDFLWNIYPIGLIEPIGDYSTLGSGAAYAELLLKDLYSYNLSLEQASKIAIYNVKEVKSIDPSVGGDINVAIINKEKNSIEILERYRVEEIDRELEGNIMRYKDFLRKILLGEEIR